MRPNDPLHTTIGSAKYLKPLEPINMPMSNWKKRWVSEFRREFGSGTRLGQQAFIQSATTNITIHEVHTIPGTYFLVFGMHMKGNRASR